MRSRRLSILTLEDRVTPTVGDLLHTLTPPGSAGGFGYSFAASSQYLVVGSYSDTVGGVSAAGAVDLYNPTTGAFIRTIPNPTPESNDEFGYSIAVAGDTVLVGAPIDNTDGTHTGAAYLFQASTGNLIATLHNPTPDPTTYEWYGCAVGLTSNGVALVGAYLEDSVNLYQGAVYTFNASTGATYGSGELAVPPSVTGGDDFGISIAVGGGRIAVGAGTDSDPGGPTTNAGGVHLYDENTLAYQRSIFDPTPHPLDFFGCSVGLSGNNLVVGAYNEYVGATTNAGAAFVYNASTGALVQTLTQPTPGNGNRFGENVAVSGDTVIVGTPYDGTQGTDNGIAYAFDAPTGTKLATINNPVTNGTSLFGWGVGAYGGDLYAGAYWTDNAYIFEGRPVSSPPQANNDSYNVAENASATQLAVLGNDTAQDTSLLTVSSVTQPSHGTVTISADNKSLLYTPTTNYIGPDSFTYTATDPNGSSTATVSIMVVGPPQAHDDSYHVPENSSATTLTVLANDVADDTNALTVSAVTQPTHGTVTISAGNKSVKYTPAAYYNGPDSFTYTAQDPNGSSTATVHITVDLVNNPPNAKDDEATVNSDSGANAIDVLANDSDPDFGQTVSITQVSQGNHGTVAITGGGTGLTYAPNAGYSGPDHFTYTISDGAGGTATASVVISVQPLGGGNSPPDAQDDSATLMEDAGAQTINVLTNDTDPDAGDTLIITTVTQGQHGTVAIAADGKSVTYNPAPDFAGDDSFLYAISDGHGGTDYASVSVTVNDDVADRLEVVTTPGTAVFTEGDVPLTVDAGLRVSTNNRGITKATIKIVSGYVKGRDVLAFTPAAGLKGSFSSSTGTLTLMGPALSLAPEATLRRVKYKNISSDPIGGVRTIAITVSDPLGIGAPATRRIQVVSVNTPPLVVLGGTAAKFTENGRPVAVASKVKVIDFDNKQAAGATIAITGNFVAAEDVLSVKLKPGITSNYNTATGVLTVTGFARLSAYASMLASVKYSNTSDGPSTATRTISFSVNDGSANSAAVTRTVDVVAVNDAPVLDTSSNPSLPDVSSGNANPSGTTIASLLGSAVIDSDAGALQGVAVTGFTLVGPGTWQYSLDGGSSWTNISFLNGKGLLLRASDMLRFLPSGTSTGTASISYRAWDQTSGTAGQLVTVGIGGGTTAFSLATETATVKVV
jgi:hypothetical protein